VAAQASGVGTGSIATISLRGLGSGRTLVLINGRRSAVYGGGSAGTAGSSVDISAIPVAAIERVEILKDGASAIYGSDAIAGVVNFILRPDYQGAEITARGGTPTHAGGGTEENFSAYAGMGDLKQDRYNVALGVNFEHVTAIMGSHRSFATRYSPGYGNDVTSGFSFPANVALPGKGTRNPNFPNCGPDSLTDVNFPNQCRFDNSPFDSLQPAQRKINVTFNGSVALTGASRLYSEASFSQVKTTTTVQPVPLSYQNPLLPGNPYIAFLANLLATQYPTYHNPAVVPGTGAFLLPPTSPYYPTAFATANGVNGQPLNLIYRDFANGLRQTPDTANTVRVVGGLKGLEMGVASPCSATAPTFINTTARTRTAPGPDSSIRGWRPWLPPWVASFHAGATTPRPRTRRTPGMSRSPRTSRRNTTMCPPPLRKCRGTSLRTTPSMPRRRTWR